MGITRIKIQIATENQQKWQNIHKYYQNSNEILRSQGATTNYSGKFTKY